MEWYNDSNMITVDTPTTLGVCIVNACIDCFCLIDWAPCLTNFCSKKNKQ